MDRIDIVLDLETLGTNNTPVIAQIGAVAFDINTGQVLREFSLPINIQSCINNGLKVDALTIKWWMNQDKKVIEEVMNGTIGLGQALNDFKKWIETVSGHKKGAVYLWGNGILADNTWLKGAYEAMKIPYPIHYKNDRDMRTLLEIASKVIDQSESFILNKIPSEGNKHNAIDDARWAAKVITSCWNLIIQ